MTTTPTLPIQPIIRDADGRQRFKKNTLVAYLLDHGGIDMNKLALVACPQDERQQFAQLIGYSLSGYSELSYVDDDAFNVAERMADGESQRDATLIEHRNLIHALRMQLREPMARLYGMHPDELMVKP